MTARAGDFHGVWQLSEWTVQLEGGDVRRPFGGDVEGYLVYSPAGWMSATLMARGRPQLSQDRLAMSKLRRTLQDDPQAQLDAADRLHLRDYFLAANGYISYSGPFDIDEHSVYHRVRVSFIPQWVGTTLSRTYAFDTDAGTLTLRASDPGAADTLVWARQQ